MSSEQTVRTSFSFLRRAVNADVLRPLSPRLTLSGRYSLETTKLFDNRLTGDEGSLIDRILPQVRLSIFSSTLFWDRRDNQISASRGTLTTTTVDYAPRWAGSEVGFVKGLFEGSYYRPLRAPRKLIYATRIQFGIARGFERQVPVKDGDGFTTVADLPASQRFFAGGSATVRGFGPDRLGVREILSDSGLSNGGNAMIVLNNEARVSAGRLFKRSLTLVGFVDAGNVFDRVGDLDLGRLRATAGFGVRYDSWFGPIRFDMGFKLDKFTFAKAEERRWSIHLSIGEVF